MGRGIGAIGGMGMEEISPMPPTTIPSLWQSVERLSRRQRPRGLDVNRAACPWLAAARDTLPGPFGALLDAVVEGLRRLPPKLPRMANLALCATGRETAFWPAGLFRQPRRCGGGRDRRWSDRRRRAYRHGEAHGVDGRLRRSNVPAQGRHRGRVRARVGRARDQRQAARAAADQGCRARRGGGRGDARLLRLP
jgi:hypothetical protein